MVRRYEIPLAAVAMAVALTAMACRGGESPPRGGQTAPGTERTPKTGALETGAAMIQDKAPVDKISMYLDGFHVAKHDPSMQMAGQPPPGVSDNGDASTRPVPMISLHQPGAMKKPDVR